MRKLTNSIAILLILLMAASCGDNNPQPKPRGYFRIDLPEKQYVALDTMRPYRFEYPVYATITPDYYSIEEKDWANVVFPAFKGTVHISYKNVDGDLSEYIEDAYRMIVKHINKATGIRDSVIVNKDKNVYGLMYFLDGEGVASPLQFYLTDSTRHFMRGSLYFNIYPNNDSLQPVIDFITDDVRHLINTLEWK